MSYALTVVIPVYNEEDNLARVEAEMTAFFKVAKRPTRALFVNDGSKDSSQQMIEDICSRNEAFSYINFAENRFEYLYWIAPSRPSDYFLRQISLITDA